MPTMGSYRWASGTTDEIAKVVLSLAFDDSSYLSGVELFLEGRLAQI